MYYWKLFYFIPQVFIGWSVRCVYNTWQPLRHHSQTRNRKRETDADLPCRWCHLLWWVFFFLNGTKMETYLSCVIKIWKVNCEYAYIWSISPSALKNRFRYHIFLDDISWTTLKHFYFPHSKLHRELYNSHRESSWFLECTPCRT